MKIQISLLLGGLGLVLNLSGQSCTGAMTVVLNGSATAEPMQVSLETQGLTCLSDVDGALKVLVEGGSPNYQFSWVDNSSTDSCRYFLSEGSYQVTVTDQQGCSETLTGEIQSLHPGNTDLATTSGCGQCALTDGSSSYYFNPEGDFIAALEDEGGDATELGNTEVCVFFEPDVSACEGQAILDRHWTVNPGNDLSACLKLYFNQGELDALATNVPGGSTSAQDLIDQQLLCLKGYSGGNEDCSSYQSVAVYSMADSPPLQLTLEDPVKGIWSVETCVNQLSNYFLEVCAPALPVELVHFWGEAKGESNQLYWETATEWNTQLFEIEASADGVHFESLGSVAAKGNSNSLTAYTFEDLTPHLGTDYYRLRIVDWDATFSYSQVIVLEESSGISQKLYPSAFSNEVYWEVDVKASTAFSVKVFDVRGRVAHQLFHRLDKGGHQLTFDLMHLARGTYFIQIQDERTNIVQNYKVVKYL